MESSSDPFDILAQPPDEEVLRLFKQGAEAAPQRKFQQMSIAEIRSLAPTPEKLGTHVRRIPGPAGDIRLDILLPDDVKGLYLHIHGGGWITGRRGAHDQKLFDIARGESIAIVSVEYRLAPEDPFPAAPDDCEAAAVWLVEHAQQEFGCDRIVIGGESAGAHLSALTLLRMRDRHGYTAIAGAQLCYGMYDLRMTPSLRNFPYPYLDRDAIGFLLDMVVPPEQRGDPEVSPLLADLHSLPPALFTVGTLDSVLDDTLFMWIRWRAAGNDADLAVYPNGWHGFVLSPTDIGRAASDRMWRFVKERLRVETAAASS